MINACLVKFLGLTEVAFFTDPSHVEVGNTARIAETT